MTSAADVARQSRLEQGLDPERIDPAIADQVARVVARASSSTPTAQPARPAPARKASAA